MCLPRNNVARINHIKVDIVVIVVIIIDRIVDIKDKG